MVLDTQQAARSRVLPMAVHHVSPDGAAALAFNYQRLELLLPGPPPFSLLRFRTVCLSAPWGACGFSHCSSRA